MNNPLTDRIPSLLTIASIFKIWIIEFVMFELIFIILIFIKQSDNKFSMSIGTDIFLTSGYKLTDFIVISVFVFIFTAVSSILLWIGQHVLSWIIPMSFNLH